MTSVADTPSYRHLHYSDFFKQNPRSLRTRSSRYHKQEDSSTHDNTCVSVMVILLGILIVYFIVKYIIPKLSGGGCSASRASARISTAASSGPVAAKSGEDLKKILSGLSGDQSAVVMFHAPWCGHCKATMPAYTSAAKNNTCNTVYVLADCHNDLNAESVKEYGIRGFPTIKKFTAKNGASEHTGGRSEEAISKFACGN